MTGFVAPTSEEFDTSNAWGLLTAVDIHDCNPETIRDVEAIKRFTRELCEKIMVKRYGEAQVVEFGDDPRVHGYSMTQLIETSLVSAHFVEETNSVYLDIFSCKHYDADKAVRFTVEFFEGKYFNALSVLRGCANNLPNKVVERNIIFQSDVK